MSQNEANSSKKLTLLQKKEVLAYLKERILEIQRNTNVLSQQIEQAVRRNDCDSSERWVSERRTLFKESSELGIYIRELTAEIAEEEVRADHSRNSICMYTY